MKNRASIVAAPSGGIARTARELYRVHGMTLDVACSVPRLRPLVSVGRDEPVSIDFEPVPLSLPAPEIGDQFFQATASSYLYRQPDAWALLVEEGRRARFEAEPTLSEQLFWYSAISNTAAVAGYQRGMYPLHGSGVLFPSGMVAFTGPSGAGKTTLTAALVLRGFPLFGDDLCLIQPRGAGYSIGRGAPEIRLLRDAAEALGWDHRHLIGHQAERDKFAFVQDDAPVDEANLRAVVELAFADGPPRLERLEGVAPLQSLVAAIRLRMGLHLFPPALRNPAFALVTRLARDVEIYRFSRPRSYCAFDKGADILVDHFGR